MKEIFRWFRSPLAGTVLVLAFIGVIALPMQRLTSASKAPASAQEPVLEDKTLPAVLRLRLLAAAKHAVVSTTNGEALWKLADVPAGIAEHDVSFDLSGHELELVLRVEFADGANESAAFLTVMPDAHDEQTAYLIGSGRVEETLRFEWRAH